MQSSGASSTRNCVSCGRTIAWDANVCPYCGHDYRAAMAGAPPPKKDSSLPLVGGILILLASLGYLGGGAVIIGGSAAFWVGEGVVCGAVMVVLGIISLLGGIFAIQKKYWAIALIGGIFVIPSVLGLIGLILVAVSRESFSS